MIPLKLLSRESVQAMNYLDTYVPEHTREGILHYIENKYETGSFLYSVFSGQLFGAVGAADYINMEHLTSIVKWIYNYAPSSCYGSPQAVKMWLSKGVDDV